MYNYKIISFNPIFGVLAIAAATAACSDSNLISDPITNETGFSHEISLAQLQQSLADGPTRVEIKLAPVEQVSGPLLAREVELKTADELAHHEEIESRVIGVEINGRSGTVVLKLGGLRIDFDETSAFKADDSQKLTFDEFVARLQTELQSGQPPIEVKRPAPSTPQDPTDETFFATQLELDDEADEPEIDINVDGDNFASAAPDGQIQVLGLEIEVRSSTGETELEEENDDVDAEVEFEGLVMSVDLTNSSVTLMDGTVINVIEGETEMEEADDDDEVGSLQAVQHALDNHQLVEADGEGVAGSEPMTIDAIEIEFELEDPDDDIPGTDEFEGLISTVDVDNEFITFADGTKILTSGATVDSEGDLFDLQAVQSALNNQQAVKAEGRSTTVSAGPPAELHALSIKYEVEN